ncbi:MAG: hypothetical protein P8X80_07380 [Desulfobacterales bacterium]
MFSDQIGKFVFGMNRNTIGVKLAGKLGRIETAGDIRNLSGGEGDNIVTLVIFEIDIKIMEIPTGRSHDDDFFDHSFILSQRNGI